MPLWIDLWTELRALMYGDSRTVAQGYWGVVRLMRVGQYSQYWNEERKEAVGGPKWNFDDYIVRIIDMPAASILSLPRLRSTEADILYAGLDNVNAQIFVVEASNRPPVKPLPRLPTQEDIMFLVQQYSSLKPPRPPLRAVDRYNITGAIPARGDIGRVEAFFMTAVRLHGEG